MKKKEFWKGVAATLAVVVACTFLWETALIQQWIPWNALPFDIGMTKSAKLRIIEKYLDQYYVEDADKEMMEEATYAGMVAGVGDRYTYYLTENNLQEYMESATGHFDGIGIEVYQTPEGEVTIFSLMEGQPAEKAGIAVGDVIVGVDDENVKGMLLSDVAKRIRGKAGTSVRVEVYRESSQKNLTFAINREDVVVKTVFSQMLTADMGYIRLSGFKENTYQQFMKDLTALQEAGMKGLVLDLRNNPGGLVNAVYKIGEELLPQGTMVYTEDKKGKRDELVCDDKYLDLPMVVLVNGGSASASEIFAGAAKDYGRAPIVGTQTFGKGLVQRLFLLPDGSGLNITIQKYFTPNGTSIHGTGVTPDYSVELPQDFEATGEVSPDKDVQLSRGMGILKEEMGKN